MAEMRDIWNEVTWGLAAMLMLVRPRGRMETSWSCHSHVTHSSFEHIVSSKCGGGYEGRNGCVGVGGGCGGVCSGFWEVGSPM